MTEKYSVMHIANVTCAVCRGKQDVSPGVWVRAAGLSEPLTHYSLF